MDATLMMPWSVKTFLEEIGISIQRVQESELFAKLIEDMERFRILETLLANFRFSNASNASTSSQFMPFGGGSASAPYRLQHEVHRTMAHPGLRNHLNTNAVALVVLGVGSLYWEKPRLQLALALLIKSRFPHLIKRISVYDPVHTITEHQVLTALGCVDIEESERLRKSIHTPTVFYLPHFPYFYADALLANNVTPWRLGWMAVLGNSLTQTVQESLERLQSVRSLLKHVFEIPIIPARPIDRFDSAFATQSWHLFPNHEIRIVTQELAQEWRSQSAMYLHVPEIAEEGEEHFFHQARAKAMNLLYNGLMLMMAAACGSDTCQ